MSRQIFRDAPDFTVDSTHGEITLHDWKRGRWAVMVSSPFSFTPVCTTELTEFATHIDEFVARGVGVVATACDTLENQSAWARDIRSALGVTVPFPLIADADRVVARAYGMIDADQEDGLLAVAPGRWMKASPDFAVRTAFVISPDNTIALTMSYPPNVGLDVGEVLRVLDALSLARHKLAAPAGWRDGDDVVVGRVLPDDVAETRFGTIRRITPYLRTTAQPGYTRRGRRRRG